MKSTGEWGKTFSPSLSPHLYYETYTRDWLQRVSDEELKRRGYLMQAPDFKLAGPGALLEQQVPDDIAGSEVPQMLTASVRCPRTNRAFNYQKKEIDYYRRWSIPLPTLHWSERLYDLSVKRDLIPDVCGPFRGGNWLSPFSGEG